MSGEEIEIMRIEEITVTIDSNIRKGQKSYV